ncbi:TPA: replication initiator protein A [Streptococcus agalactiae]|uniref:replication initiator protein A n=1 Tax=Streptococcus agalactiae TaxID=1311 RepID=UPI0005E1FE15|nr:replication initiator protein A [Streptococcus agalactiae]KAA8958376.1 MarR family transcriptional regulator [Streptococcus agalactiae]KAA9086375.1 MarR family transcriptional regulator [Streptococcus agalactiae]KAA9103786.1 MarR family transcriptional regulator [Streptococcus agalactiae]KLJ22142.1 replication initiation factor [Streptococcus agalactiae]KLL78971.1 replication initiation factor [Streptococcus agalactiae]
MDYDNENYLIPKILLQDDLYSDLTAFDILVYAVLRGKQEEAFEKGWIDAEGNVYLGYKISDLAKKCSCAKSTMTATLQRLEEVDLIERDREMIGHYYSHNLPYRTYINEV